MSSARRYYVYTGVTNDLIRRMYQHKCGAVKGFTAKYKVTRLVYYEETPNSRAAVARERQIKGLLRERKLRLIESINTGWLDLAENWFTGLPGVDPSLRSG
jgi:putative endonuclease